MQMMVESGPNAIYYIDRGMHFAIHYAQQYSLDPFPVSSIKCWDCNSRNNVPCAADPFEDFTAGYVDCDQVQEEVAHLEPDMGYVPNATICRKTVQLGIT